MAKVPETNAGLPEEAAIQAGEMLRQGWDVLRSLQFNPKASILRYTKSGTLWENNLEMPTTLLL